MTAMRLTLCVEVQCMPGFRIFYVDGSAGHITGSHDFNATDDLAAIRQVEEYRTGGAMELWSGTRKIKTWEATPPLDGNPSPK